MASASLVGIDLSQGDCPVGMHCVSLPITFSLLVPSVALGSQKAPGNDIEV